MRLPEYLCQHSTPRHLHVPGRTQQAAAFHGPCRHHELLPGSTCSAHTAFTAQRAASQLPRASSAHSFSAPAQAVRRASAAFGSSGSSRVSGLRPAQSRFVAAGAAPTDGRRGLGMAAPFVYQKRASGESDDVLEGTTNGNTSDIVHDTHMEVGAVEKRLQYSVVHGRVGNGQGLQLDL